METFGKARGAWGCVWPPWRYTMFWLLRSRCLAITDADGRSMRGDKLTLLAHYFGTVTRREVSRYRVLHYILRKFFVGSWNMFNRTLGCIAFINTCFSNKIRFMRVSSILISRASVWSAMTAKNRLLHRKFKTTDAKCLDVGIEIHHIHSKYINMYLIYIYFSHTSMKKINKLLIEIKNNN